MIRFFIFLFSLTSVFSYNLDYQYPLIYSDYPDNNTTYNNSSSYFGFSVLLVPEWNTSEATLVVGAPKANHTTAGKSINEPGVIHLCTLFGKCQQISSTSDSSPFIFIPEIETYAKVIKDNGWFGMSISALHPTLFKICAPRTKVNFFKPFDSQATDQYINKTMQGICYFYFNFNNTPFLKIENESLTEYNFSSLNWYNPQYGFSQSVARGIPLSMKMDEIETNESIIIRSLLNTSSIIGNPSGSVSIIQANKRKTLVLSNYKQEQAKFGYSVTSGRFFSKQDILFASGAPAWKLVGKVAIIDSSTDEPTIRKYLFGNHSGEYFGASLTSCDLNNDGFDDLVVGAPHFNEDLGKVYIYLGSQDDFLENNITIEGKVIGGQFGYALSSGDLDGDGFDDLIIGAPGEQSGAIYIYNGFAILGEENDMQMSQRIAAVDISKNIRGFGFSISNLVDMDKNRFVDVGVGAYKSGHAVVLRGKPVEKSQIDLKAQPAVIKKGTTKVSPEFCMRNYKNTSPQIVENFTIKITIDPKYKRFMYDYIVWHVPITEKNNYQVFQYRYSRQTKLSRLTNPHWNGCTTSHFSLKPEIHNKIDPVDIVLTYEFNTYRINTTKNDSNDSFCKFCPIEYQGRELKTIKLLIPFESDCGKGKICNPDISITTSMLGVVGENNTWEIGSDDISVEAKFQNHGEPAYFVVADFFIPKMIHLRSLLTSCQESMKQDSLVVTCDVGNPLGKHTQKTIRLDLDMRYFKTHYLNDIESHKFFINMTIKSANSIGVKQISIPLTFKNNVSMSISGKIDDNSYNLTEHQQKNENVSFQHTYNVFKNGPTPIFDGQIIIDVPTGFKNGESFIFIKNPQLQILGSTYSCITDNVPSSAGAGLEDLEENKYKLENIYIIEKRSTSSANHHDKQFMYSLESFEKNSSDIFSIDCSKDEVQCGKVICDLAVLKTFQNAAIVLPLTLNLKSLKKLFLIGSTIQYSTKARMKIPKPLIDTSEIILTTKLYSIEDTSSKSSVNIWIIVVISVIIGLILLSVIVVILRRAGFFSKKQKSNYNFLTINEREHEEQYFMEFQERDENSPGSDSFSLNEG